MSKRSKSSRMSREELEIHAILSPSSQSTVSAGVPLSQADNSAARASPPGPQLATTSARAPPPQGLPGPSSATTLSDDCMRGLAHIFKDAMSEGFEAYFGKNKARVRRREPSPVQESDEYSDGYDSGDESEDELGLPMQGPLAAGIALPTFGAHVNDLPRQDHDYSKQIPVVAQGPSGAPHVGKIVDPTPPAVVEPQPDSSLPLKQKRAPTNWHPDPEVLRWACITLDDHEWSVEDRKVLSDQFSPQEVDDHLFQAVPCPPDMKAALTNPEVIKSDFLFKRADAEDLLYEANQDLACSLRPLTEVLSSTRNVPGMENIRTLLANVFQGIASASSKLTRGRREICRRFVPLDHAAKLYESPTSHLCFFGGKSVDTAVSQAKAAAVTNKDLVYIPKKRKYTSKRGSYGYGSFPKSSWNNSSQFFRGKGPNRGKFGSGQRGRGRGPRRSRGKKAKTSQSKAATQE